MSNDASAHKPPNAAPGKPLSAAAIRALEEALARKSATKVVPAPRELHGRDGLEPVRYGDWEVRGLATDF